METDAQLYTIIWTLTKEEKTREIVSRYAITAKMVFSDK